jgi:hypothetical protein
MQNVDALFNSVKNANSLLPPTVKKVDVPHGPACNIITFEFALLLRLLQNSALMTAENLAIDIANCKSTCAIFKCKSG